MPFNDRRQRHHHGGGGKAERKIDNGRFCFTRVFGQQRYHQIRPVIVREIKRQAELAEKTDDAVIKQALAIGLTAENQPNHHRNRHDAEHIVRQARGITNEIHIHNQSQNAHVFDAREEAFEKDGDLFRLEHFGDLASDDAHAHIGNGAQVAAIGDAQPIKGRADGAMFCREIAENQHRDERDNHQLGGVFIFAEKWEQDRHSEEHRG